MQQQIDGRLRLVLMLIATCGAATCVFLTVGVTFAGLPQIGGDLKVGQSDLQWIGDGYPLVLASLLLPAGVLADRFSRKWALVGGMAVQSAGMLWAATAESSGVLIAALCLAALGAGTAFPCTLATITIAAPPERRSMSVGMWAASVPLGGMGGTLISGFMIELTDTWEAGYVVVGVLAGALSLLSLISVPETRDPGKQYLDPIGALLSVIGVATLVLGIIEGPVDGWTDPFVLLWLGISAVALTAFVLWEAHTEHPLLDVRLFKLRGFSSAAIAICCIFFALYAITFLAFQYEAYALGYTPLEGALGLFPMVFLMLPFALLGPTAARRWGAKPVIAFSLVIGGLGAALLAGIGTSGGYWPLALGFFFFGGSVGLGAGPVTEAITDQLPPAKQGVASAVNNLTRELGSVFGIAIAGTTFNIGYRHEIDAGLDPANDPVAAIAKESPAAGLQAAAQTGDQAGRYLGVIDSGVDLGWIVAMSTVAAFFMLALAQFWWRFPRSGRDELPEFALEGPPVPTAPTLTKTAAPPRALGPALVGTVTRAGGTPVTAIGMVLTDLAGKQVDRTRSDEHGRYQLAVPLAGQYILVCTSPAHPVHASLVVVGAHGTPHDVVLPGGSTVLGSVRVSGRPAAGATVALLDSHTGVLASAATGDNGAYRFDDLEAGRRTVAGLTADGGAAAATVDVPDTGIVRCDLDIEAGHRVAAVLQTGTVPCPGATVALVDAGGRVVASAAAGSDGTVVFDNVEPGEYTLSAAISQQVSTVVAVPGSRSVRTDIAPVGLQRLN